MAVDYESMAASVTSSLQFEHRVNVWSAFIPMSDEALIDLGLGTPEMIVRDEARWAELRRRRRSWRGRLLRLRLATADYRGRLGHALDALRGIECPR